MAETIIYSPSTLESLIPGERESVCREERYSECSLLGECPVWLCESDKRRIASKPSWVDLTYDEHKAVGKAVKKWRADRFAACRAIRLTANEVE